MTESSKPDRFTSRIIEHIADKRYMPRKTGDLASELSIPESDLEEFQRSVQRLVDEGQVLLLNTDTVALPPPGKEMVGIFRLNQRGFGFIIPDSRVEHGDLFVPPGATGGAMTGDRVRAQVIHQKGRGSGGGPQSPYVGQIVQIIQRADKTYVGNLLKQGSRYFVQVDGKTLTLPVLIRDPHSKNAKVGDKVVIELIEYPSETSSAEGVITEILGEQGQPDIETRAIMRGFGLPETFPANVMDDARAAAASFRSIEQAAGGLLLENREDLSNNYIITIDPPDAKDYDDAISIRRIIPAMIAAENLPAEAAWELGVHIADVSHFVKLDSPMDAEAKVRGNSVYLPRKVIPMLPEVLSNGVCSLQEGVNRFCKTAFMIYDEDGNVVGERFANTMIKSAKRLTYLEAQCLIGEDIKEAKRHAKTEPKYPRQLMDTLKLMDELAKTIRSRRLSHGMIELGLPEVELIFDESGRVVDAQPEDDAFTHKMIEMFMVEANEAVARLFHSLAVPMIRRIHPDPDAHDITGLRQFARVAGLNIPSRPSRKELQELLDAVRGKPSQTAVHLAVLKTLSRAEYSPLVIGHFALASEHYTHFTSPIRRYADLMVHRGLDSYFDACAQARKNGASERDIKQATGKSEIARLMRADLRCAQEAIVASTANHLSETDRNAESAEDQLRTYLVLDLLTDHLGEDYDGTVTGVTSQGIFVQIDKYLIDGFVRVADLPGKLEDRWRLNHHTGAMVAQRSGRTISIGHRFVVRVAKVNPAGRHLEVVVVSDLNAGGAKNKDVKPAGKPGGKPDPIASTHHGDPLRIKYVPPQAEESVGPAAEDLAALPQPKGKPKFGGPKFGGGKPGGGKKGGGPFKPFRGKPGNKGPKGGGGRKK